MRPVPRLSSVAEDPRPPLEVAEPIVGFRSWRILGRGENFTFGGIWRPVPDSFSLLLRGPVQPVAWLPGRNDARCRNVAQDDPKPHAAPVPHCRCGLYAYYDPCVFGDSRGGGQRSVVGAIRAWGDVRLGDIEFRAQHAEIVALGDDDPPREALDAAVLYGVPIVPFDRLASYASEFGVVVPKDERPPRENEENPDG